MTTALNAVRDRVRRDRRWAAVAVAVLLCGLVLAALWSSLIGGQIFGSGDIVLSYPPFSAHLPVSWSRPANYLLSDSVFGFNPQLLVQRAAVRAGSLPLWNPYIGSGSASIFLPAALYPVAWLAFVLPFWHALGWIVAAKLLIAGWGAYLYCRELGLERGPAALAAVVFPFSSYFWVWLEHPHTSVWAMLPWMFLGARRICARSSLGGVAILGIAGGLACLGNHQESTAIVFTATFAYGIFELVRSRSALTSDRKLTVRRGSLFAAALMLGLGIGAVVILPLKEALSVAPSIQRGGGPGAPFSTLSSFVFPELFGVPSKAVSVNPAGWNFNERTTYFGALPLMLAVATLGRRRPREQWFFVGLFVIVVLTVFNTPFWAHAIANAPGIKAVSLGRLRVLLSFSGAVLAAYGLQRWLTGSVSERRYMLRLMGVTAVLPMVVWLPWHTRLLADFGSALQQLPSVHPSETSTGVVALGSVWRWVVLCAIGLVVLMVVRRRTAALAVAVVIALTAVDLITLGHGYHGPVPLAHAHPPAPRAIRYLQAHQGHARVTASEDAIPPDIGAAYGLRDMRVFDVIPTVRYELVWARTTRFLETFDFYAGTPNAQFTADLFSVRYVLLPPTEPAPSWLHPVLRTSGGTVAYNPTALPRAWMAYSWRPASSRTNDFHLAIGSTRDALYEQPVIEGAVAPSSPATPAPSAVHFAIDKAEEVTLDVVARHAGYLILNDSAYPGWRATVDGHPAAWKYANVNFRAVPVPAGRHVVRFTYTPGSVVVGAIISLVSLFVTLTLAAVAVIRRRRRAPALTTA